MNRAMRRAKINRANERKQRREFVSEFELDAANKDYYGIKITLLIISILSGFFLYRWFAVSVIASWNLLSSLFVSFIFTAVLGLILFLLSDFLLSRQLSRGNRLTGVTFLTSIVGVIIGVAIASFVNLI